MKINISVEATPKEIREVFGLPDIQDVQGLFLNQFKQNLQDGQVDKDVVSELMGPSLQFSKNFMDTLMGNMESLLNQSNQASSNQQETMKDSTSSQSKQQPVSSEEY
jgi:hypothetical protein